MELVCRIHRSANDTLIDYKASIKTYKDKASHTRDRALDRCNAYCTKHVTRFWYNHKTKRYMEESA